MRMQETREPRAGPQGQEDPLQEETATFAGILAWRISRTEELAVTAVGSRGGGHD